MRSEHDGNETHIRKLASKGRYNLVYFTFKHFFKINWGGCTFHMESTFSNGPFMTCLFCLDSFFYMKIGIVISQVERIRTLFILEREEKKKDKQVSKAT